MMQKCRRTRSKACMTFIVIGVIEAVVLICVAITYGVKYLQNREPQFCETPACFESATEILFNMDESIDPCENFYKFACGGFINSADVPSEFSSVTIQAELSDKLNKQLNESFESGTREGDPRAFEVVQNFYKLCTDVDRIERTSKREIRGMLKELGGWPVVEGEKWDESKFSWTNVMYKIREMGFSFNSFFEVSLIPDIKNNSRRILSLDQASFVLDRVYLIEGTNNEIVEAYFEYMLIVAEIFGVPKSKSRKELSVVLDFEIELAEFSLPDEKRRNFMKMYNIMTIDRLQAKYSSIPWLEYINEILKPHVTVDLDEPIMVIVPSYFEAFSKLIENVPKRVLSNYAIWRVIADSVIALSKDIRVAEMNFKNKLVGATGGEERWKDCLDFISEAMPLATGALYVNRHFDEDTKAKAAEIVHNIYESYREILEKVDWMGEETKRKALIKLDAMKINVAYVDELLDNQKLDGFYQNYTIDGSSFLKTVLNASLAVTARQHKQLRGSVGKNDWTNHGYTAVMNAFNQPMENSIDLPAGILQGVFFSKYRPNYLNYGTIGFVMGHEITHGFDNTGKQFDENGNVVNWWDPATEQRYQTRIRCMIDQYNNYTIEEIEIQVNGVNTLDENIADNGGIKEAYYAYEKWEKLYGLESRIHENYTSQQMFWIGSANAWCQNVRPEALHRQILIDEHAPSEFRIIGSFSNLPEFARDFQCPLGSPMNPVKKCTVW